MELPKHIVIIPDGNRRWAKENGLASFLGHKKGAEISEAIFRTAVDQNIPYVTFWGCSIDNVTKRPDIEVKFLYKVIGDIFTKLVKNKDIEKKEVGIKAFGEWQKYFPDNTKKAVEKAIEKTKNYKKFQLNFMLAYSGKGEMIEAIKKIAREKEKKQDLKIDEETIKKNLPTKELPPVDLIIRTGGEPHMSDGFMMWHTANSHMYFTKTFWPDFSPEEFKKAIRIFGSTERRFGK